MDRQNYRCIDVICIIYKYITPHQASVARSTLAGGFDITVSGITVSGERFATAPPGLAKVRFGTYIVSAKQLGVRHLSPSPSFPKPIFFASFGYRVYICWL